VARFARSPPATFPARLRRAKAARRAARSIPLTSGQ